MTIFLFVVVVELFLAQRFLYGGKFYSLLSLISALYFAYAFLRLLPSVFAGKFYVCC